MPNILTLENISKSFENRLSARHCWLHVKAELSLLERQKTDLAL